MGRSIPSWLKTDLPDAESLGRIRQTVESLGLNTICYEARCPNKAECFSENSVTFLILGRCCTRSCRFCNVEKFQPNPVQSDEPERLLRACKELGIDYVVLTSVSRDDLPDYGASHFALCVEKLRADLEGIELLTPDFMGRFNLVDRIMDAGPDVFGHNIETVERLYPTVRDRAEFRRSLDLLEYVKSHFPEVITKTGLLVGLGERLEEVRKTIVQVSEAGCEIITIGQYMQPSRLHLPVSDYVAPGVFAELKAFAEELGLVAICGPKVRSSFGARAAYDAVKSRRVRCE